jgi:hypothetical protein
LSCFAFRWRLISAFLSFVRLRSDGFAIDLTFNKLNSSADTRINFFIAASKFLLTLIKICPPSSRAGQF